MVTHCANPGCVEQFRFLGEGKLFLEDPQAALDFNQQQLFERCFWLCRNCARQFEIRFINHKPLVVPRISQPTQLRQSRGA
jgi:hypothetical protein